MHLSMDCTFCSLANSAFFGTARPAPASAAFSRGPSSDEFSSNKSSSCRRSHQLIPSTPLFVWISANHWLDIWNSDDNIHSLKKVVKQLHCIFSLAITIKTLKKLKLSKVRKDSGRKKSCSRAKKLLVNEKLLKKLPST